MYVWHVHASALRGQKRMTNPLDMELLQVACQSLNEGAGDQNLVVCKNSKCS